MQIYFGSEAPKDDSRYKVKLGQSSFISMEYLWENAEEWFRYFLNKDQKANAMIMTLDRCAIDYDVIITHEIFYDVFSHQRIVYLYVNLLLDDTGAVVYRIS